MMVSLILDLFFMEYGKVKWFDAEKGFGFIKPDEGGRDIFVHRNNIEGLGYDEGLNDGEEVEFDVEETPKGLSAIEVRRV
jgi:CspA family cold shock protein